MEDINICKEKDTACMGELPLSSRYSYQYKLNSCEENYII